MNARLLQELQQLSTAEKRALGEALIVSADSEAFAPAISDEQRSELVSRLAHHRANSAEIGVDFAQLKASILGTSR